MAKEKPYNLEPEIESALSYIPFVALPVLIMEKENKFVRFHAYQSIFFWISLFALYSMAHSLKLLIIGIFLIPLVRITAFVLWIFLTWKAYNKEKFELPLIGELAERQVRK